MHTDYEIQDPKPSIKNFEEFKRENIELFQYPQFTHPYLEGAFRVLFRIIYFLAVFSLIAPTRGRLGMYTH